ncbi:MAG: vanadium-dependent haloperoxidase [Acidobacteriaceae bacterium]|nr:vanadium-dependent haloperoxidase [Acidobacteriaceae bacterium]
MSRLSLHGNCLSASRRRFLSATGGALGLITALKASVQDSAENDLSPSAHRAEARRQRMYNIRTQAAYSHLLEAIPSHANNGDERRYPNRIGNFSKGLPHDSCGEVDSHAYDSLLRALHSGDPGEFENIVMGGSALLVNPQAGLAFDLEGIDSHQTSIPPAPALASARRAAEAVELYWQALLRDVPFSQYAAHPLAQQAIEELNHLSDYGGPRDPATGQISAQTLFRGFTPQDVIGPYISQFLYFPLQYGAAQITQRFQTTLPIGAGGVDWLIDYDSWLRCQNGQAPFDPNRYDPELRHVRSGRDIGQYVHVDVLFEAYFNACLWLIDNGAPLSPTNPYRNSRTQTGFGTFGPPHLKTIVAEASTRALKGVWFQKWFVHRVLRPEAFGGLVHNTLVSKRSYPLHPDILNSNAVQQVFGRNGTYLLPHAFPEGCPQHPSYGQGHGTVAGACATIVKAFFDESWVIPNPVIPSGDGLSLVPYQGADASQLTVGGEMNKLAANIAIGRNHAAVHWRSDYEVSLRLGEQIAISILRDQRNTYSESFPGFVFTSFDGERITI